MKQKDNTMRETPETDEATRTTDWLSGEPMVPSEFARRLECERDEAFEKLHFLKSRGLEVGLLKSSDCPQGQLMYHIEPESELCDLRYIHNVIEASIKRNEAQELAMYAIQCLSGIINDLPSSRDWLNPDLEKLSLAVIEKAKEVLGEA